ncbi:hypothetical protein KFK09_026753 [Dendrobium nobile]|uniref:Uncharacterized protein n=1 Tax=Dendrobium nobile TaxID=94219 RepID=A0A8T3A8E7_DENNO|nr:hypothetical protein KFK09_026753 [Dendrobium nobile]
MAADKDPSVRTIMFTTFADSDEMHSKFLHNFRATIFYLIYFSYIVPYLPMAKILMIHNTMVATAMAIDSLSSPHRRSQNPNSFSPSPSRKHRDDLGSWSTLLHRHRFLLTMLALLAFLCTIYLYFAVTLGTPDSCSGLEGTEKALCQSNLISHNGKLKLL